MEGKIILTVGEVIGFLGGIGGFMAMAVAFLIKRSVFHEIDVLKEGKQDKPHCVAQKALCGQEQTSLCDDLREVKNDLKEGRKEFKAIDRKIERLMGAMKVKFDDLNGE